jgi:thioester reductase-like protein
MSPAVLLASLYQQGVTLEITGDLLRCRAPAGVITPALQAEIAQARDDLLRLLRAAHADQSQAASNLPCDLRQEVQQAEVIFTELSDETDALQPEKILLTGATGFLGTFLLNELLAQTRARIYCLVRAQSPEKAREKIRRAFLTYELSYEDLETRLVPVIGDLAQPLWGLSEQHFQELAEEIEVIYHNGAFMNLVYPYTLLKATNVFGTRQAIQFALQSRVKPLHHISTVSVLAPATPMEHIDEHISIDDFCDNLTIGYSQSKWVAEMLVARARARGLPATIYRPGLISGHSRSGACNTRDYLSRIVKGCLQLGAMPTTSYPVSLTPVDYVSRAVVALSLQRDARKQVFHLVNPHNVTGAEIVSWIRDLGYDLREVPYAEWGRILLEQTRRSTENALYPLLQIFLSADPSSQQVNAFSANLGRFGCQHTVEVLEKSNIRCPPVDYQLLATYIGYFQRSGFLDLPDAFAVRNC